jgi:endonuclease/exonuclease/phosphatase family metal-dependent hydrolase
MPPDARAQVAGVGARTASFRIDSYHMRIGTYNVQGFRGYPPEAAAPVLRHPDDEIAAAHFARVFEALDCDVLAVQEGPSARQMHRVAGLLGCRMAGFSSPLHWPGYLLSRYSILDSRTFSRWRPLADRWPFSRMGGQAHLQLEDGSRILVIALHLHPRHERIRRAEAAFVQERMAELMPAAAQAIVLGDFNSMIDEPIHVHLRKLGFVNAMAAAGGGIQPTHDTTGAKKFPVDHIYLSPSLAPRLTHAYLVREPGFWHDGPLAPSAWLHSDHLPVVAEVGKVTKWGRE